MTKKQPQTIASVLQRIKTEGITPRPRWHFVARNLLVWGLGVLLVTISALFVAIGIFIVRNETWSLYALLGTWTARGIMVLIPIVWILVAGVFMAAADIAVQHTRYGYRYATRVIIGAIGIVSIVCGYALYRSGTSYLAEQWIHRVMPIYKTVEMRREQLHDPRDGRLIGTIASVTPTAIMVTHRITGVSYNVDTTLLAPDIREQMRVGEDVALIGIPYDDMFRACDVRPLPREGFMRSAAENHQEHFANPAHIEMGRHDLSEAQRTWKIMKKQPQSNNAACKQAVKEFVHDARTTERAEDTRQEKMAR